MATGTRRRACPQRREVRRLRTTQSHRSAPRAQRAGPPPAGAERGQSGRPMRSLPPEPHRRTATGQPAGSAAHAHARLVNTEHGGQWQTNQSPSHAARRGMIVPHDHDHPARPARLHDAPPSRVAPLDRPSAPHPGNRVAAPSAAGSDARRPHLHRSGLPRRHERVRTRRVSRSTTWSNFGSPATDAPSPDTSGPPC